MKQNVIPAQGGDDEACEWPCSVCMNLGWQK